MVQRYSSTDSATAWKHSRFILSGRLDYHMVDNESISVHASPMHMLTSLSFDEIWLPRYMKWSNDFRGLVLNEQNRNYTRIMRTKFKKHKKKKWKISGHLPPISYNIQERGTRHAGYCGRSKDELGTFWNGCYSNLEQQKLIHISLRGHWVLPRESSSRLAIEREEREKNENMCSQYVLKN